MGLERRLFRGMFDETEVVELRQTCFTPSRVFQPGKYIAGELPDIAFNMGLVEKLPPVRGEGIEIPYPEKFDLDSESE
ncbi:MAG: hypothetical protein WAN66_19465 [Limnoraphis robusta]|jgi:hypothetical protein|uniref:8-amino-7-oxononanoate synthase n=2 Tax=Limnoraphis robusta TaxID=1118279 RepID=A0A0F5Y758_9CYAN|nr:hypothetical protein [Limnoraphis robusta]MCG5057844.1 hypothetical protein [Limnoraphis sp. WC205]KKD34492.1 8-amino-7-oxononanoate synthase [Limnoraphis robusta CS-951]MEA5499430.1 hypothetical protein [Limnoraphis robusta BA-68 BA1]MEA5518538.1 hypothetical protein [Limnoraphis robusta CCNP1315]MEA5539158.1 hypothetical protein [Limnoraphis robusta Tam1]